MSRTVRIGGGAAFADDRIDPAVELVEHGRLDYLVFECLAERTIALSQVERRADPGAGYNEWLVERMEATLPAAARAGTRIITNMGAANPEAAAKAVRDVARRAGLTGLTIAAVVGDDVLDLVRDRDLPFLDLAGTAATLGDDLLAANAYIGCEPIAAALDAGADVVVTGRMSDPSLALGPLVHEFGWALDDWDLLGKGTLVGHLLECAAQITGGYFADPGVKDVPDLARVGFPIAVVAADGSAEITKVPGSGGMVTVATCTEQLLYEVHDPSAYVTPDVTADFGGVTFEQAGPDRVLVAGATGRERPAALKVSVGYVDSCIGGGEISYAGPNALARGRMALDIVRQRMEITAIEATDTRFEVIGVDAVHRGTGGAVVAEPPEVRIRVVARTPTMHDARRVGREVVGLWTNGPSGGGGATRTAHEVVASASLMLPRTDVSPSFVLLEV